MPLCLTCLPLGYCRLSETKILKARDVTPEIATDAAAFTSKLAVTPGQWPYFLVKSYRDYSGRFVDKTSGAEADLDIEQLYRSPDEIDLEDELDSSKPFQTKEWRTWYRDNLTRAEKKRRLGHPARWAVVLTILKARYPKESYCWGLRAANDNIPPVPSSPKCG